MRSYDSKVIRYYKGRVLDDIGKKDSENVIAVSFSEEGIMNELYVGQFIEDQFEDWTGSTCDAMYDDTRAHM